MQVTDQKQTAISTPLIMAEQKHKSIFSVAVLVAALGYFVDIYDLLLFSIVRVESLRSLLNCTRESCNQDFIALLYNQYKFL